MRLQAIVECLWRIFYRLNQEGIYVVTWLLLAVLAGEWYHISKGDTFSMKYKNK